MAQFQVTSAIKEREYSTAHGTFVSYILALKDESGADVTAKLSQKPETPAPSGVLHGSIEQTNFGPKFVKEKPAFGGGAPRAGGQSYVKDPAERASIERQVSLKGAIEFAGYVMAHGGRKTAMTSADVIKVAEAFDSYLKHGKAPSSAPTAPAQAQPDDTVQQHPADDPQDLQSKISNWKQGEEPIDFSDLPDFGSE